MNFVPLACSVHSSCPWSNDVAVELAELDTDVVAVCDSVDEGDRLAVEVAEDVAVVAVLVTVLEALVVAVLVTESDAVDVSDVEMETVSDVVADDVTVVDGDVTSQPINVPWCCWSTSRFNVAVYR
jgi:hypothetical protein